MPKRSPGPLALGGRNAGPLILNVNDSEAGRYATTRMLLKGGFTVIEAANGAAALELLAEPQESGEGLRAQVDAWERLANRSFFRSYRKAMAGHPSCPATPAAAEALVTLSLAERAIAAVTRALEEHALNAGAAMRRLLQVAQRGR